MIVSARSVPRICVVIDRMRLRVPGRSRDESGPDESEEIEPGTETTQAPAPTEGRGPRIQRAARSLAIASAQFLLISAAVVALFWVLGKLWSILLPIVLGLLIATVLWPATRFLRKHRWPPALAASTVLLAAVTAFVGIIVAIAPSVADQVTELSDAATSALQDVQEWLQGPPFNFGEDQIGSAVDSVINSIQNNAQNIAGYALTGATVVGNSLVNLVLALVLVFFFLKDGPRWVPWLSAQATPG